VRELKKTGKQLFIPLRDRLLEFTMLESLGNIKNPLTRSLVAATTTASVLVLTASIVLGLTDAKERSAFKFALYFSLLGTGGAAIAGFFYQSVSDLKHPILLSLILKSGKIGGGLL
jgi:FtsH-binding integral membrane protein